MSAYYIPHHAVIKEDSETTKLKVVFNASCKTTSGQSINEFFITGLEIYSKTYLTSSFVCVSTITYGMSNFLFMAIRCLQETAHQSRKDYPRTSETILKETIFYVDNLLTGANLIKELEELKHDVTSILFSAKFKLTKWKSNAPEIIDLSIDEATVKLGQTTKILNLWWNTTTDIFHYRVKLNNDKEKVTKRNMLAKTAEIYDPLGWISPTIVQAKIILHLWLINKDWDEDITGETYTMWSKWRAQISLFESILIPRRILCDNPTRIEMHDFCSIQAI
ncbi:PREDICTED: uncharacterized protein LOC108749082 [Trachymyrmex septentrionalis]|uniref:uncharacterized protein LOC108749082 n=1 Tax=Trachymyrmex septentrionalis TaxID=34720 RepID=UPI00084F3861|nr:PREDICTED: uncharacterized protein LOC108749082 [Trachymyrmex septentrionalis]